MTLADPRAANLGYVGHGAARAAPEATALIDLSGAVERHVSHAELDARMDRVAALASARGLVPGDRVAMAVGNRFEFVEIMFGLMRAGLVPVPLNVKLGLDQLRYVVQDAGCRAAIVEPAACRHAVEVTAELAAFRLALGEVPAGFEPYDAALDATAPDFAPPVLAADHPAFLPYTSGSTGRPKGVVLTHAGQLWWTHALQRYWPSTAAARALVAMPLYHKNAMAGAIKPLLLVGGSAVLLPNFEPVRFLETLARHRCTRASGVPAAFSMMLKHQDLIARLDFSALASLSIGSAPVTKELADRIEAAFGVPVGESYGLTEGGPVMLGPPIDGRPVPHGSCGVPWPEGDVKLVGTDGREHASEGELWVKNPGVTPGYYRLDEVNRERLVDGWLRTGDLFHRDGDGFFYFRGRVDDMFNCGGENVYPKEVENLLLAHPAVADACVVPVPHAVKGEVPVALVMAKAPDAVTADELKAYTLEHGPAYAHPRRIDLVDAIPLNGAGKNDRVAVTALMRERHADLARAVE